MTRTTAEKLPALPGLLPAAMGPLATISALVSSPALAALEAWKAVDLPSVELRAQLPGMLADLDTALIPATDRELAVAIAKLLEYSALLGVKITDSKETAAIYAETLGDLPGPLLDEAIRATKRSHKFNTLPRPAEIRAHVSDDFGALKVARSRAQVAMSMAERQRLPVGPLALVPQPSASGPRELPADVREALDSLKARNRAGRAANGDWRADPPKDVRPRADLVAKWTAELGLEG